jgi:hypothetical protein
VGGRLKVPVAVKMTCAFAELLAPAVPGVTRNGREEATDIGMGAAGNESSGGDQG